MGHLVKSMCVGATVVSPRTPRTLVARTSTMELLTNAGRRATLEQWGKFFTERHEVEEPLRIVSEFTSWAAVLQPLNSNSVCWHGHSNLVSSVVIFPISAVTTDQSVFLGNCRFPFFQTWLPISRSPCPQLNQL